MQRLSFGGMLDIFEKQNNEARANGSRNQGTTRTLLVRCIAVVGFLRDERHDLTHVQNKCSLLFLCHKFILDVSNWNHFYLRSISNMDY